MRRPDHRSPKPLELMARDEVRTRATPINAPNRVRDAEHAQRRCCTHTVASHRYFMILGFVYRMCVLFETRVPAVRTRIITVDNTNHTAVPDIERVNVGDGIFKSDFQFRILCYIRN